MLVSTSAKYGRDCRRLYFVVMLWGRQALCRPSQDRQPPAFPSLVAACCHGSEVMQPAPSVAFDSHPVGLTGSNKSAVP
jgi:hypothetical protein